MFTVQQVIDLQNIFDANPDLELIEVWNNRLYLRPATGRCKIASMPESLKNCENLIGLIYVNLKRGIDYVRKLLFKFHPDRSKSKSSDEITQNLNQWKDLYNRCDLGKKLEELFTHVARSNEFGKFLSFFDSGISFVEWISNRFSNGIAWVQQEGPETARDIARRERSWKIYQERHCKSKT